MVIKLASLTPGVVEIVQNKGTEKPNTGKYNNYSKDIKGTYICRQCGFALFRADNKFVCSCGWPSFDERISHNVKQQLDQDNIRTEALCNNCDAHLGHVFTNEAYTAKNIRYCINSLAVDFLENSLDIIKTEEAIVAAGCFWGVEALFKKLKGVLFTESGYIGGDLINPDYKTICSKNTGHLEAVRVIFDPSAVNYNSIIKYFFEIHDFEQLDGQGPDKGSQYLSAVFYYNETQKLQSQEVIKILTKKGYSIATTLNPASIFWPAESYHQDYYTKNNSKPYCHIKKSIF